MNDVVPRIFEKAIAKTPYHINPNNEGILRVVENDPSCSCEWVEISTKTISSFFCFTLDFKDKNNCDTVFPFFNANKETSISGLRSKNDAILICQVDERISILLIELKSENTGKYLQQLESSKIFVNFIIDRFNLVNKSFQIKKENIEFKGILFRCRKRSNRGTTVKKDKAKFENRNASFLITEEPCHNIYRLQYFLS